MFRDTTVLVAGASGFIGSSVTERLATKLFGASGIEIHALARQRGALSQIRGASNIQFHPCDLGDAEATMRVLSEVNPHIVFHFASHPDAPESWNQSAECIRANIQGTVNLMEAYVRCSNARTLVYGDSTKVYGDSAEPFDAETPVSPRSSYAISKAAAWQFCQLYGRLASIDVISVRPTLIYGPRQPFNLFESVLKSLREGAQEIRLNGGDQTRSPLYIEDAVDAYLLAAATARDCSGAAINIGGVEEITVCAIAERIVEWMESTIPVIASPDDMRETDVQRSTCDLSDAWRMLGWKPKTSLEEGFSKLRASLTPKAGAPVHQS